MKQMTLEDNIQILQGPGWEAMFLSQESGPGTRAISEMDIALMRLFYAEAGMDRVW